MKIKLMALNLFKAKIFSAHFTQKIILDYQMFTIVQHGKTIARSRNNFNNAITVMYFLTFILKDPVDVVVSPHVTKFKY